MSKYDIYIKDFLLQQKHVELEQIGVFNVTSEIEKISIGNQMTDVPVTNFVFDRKVRTSAELIDYIAEQTSKGKALVGSDIASHLDQVRQFINIGKPYIIHNVGAIYINNSGGYEFSQQLDNFLKTEEKYDREIFHSEVEQRESRTKNKNWLMGLAVVVVLIVLAGLSWFGYQYYLENKNTQTEENVNPESANESDSNKNESSTGTNSNVNTTQTATVNYAPTDSVNCKFFFESTPHLERARTRIEQLQSFRNPAYFDSVTNNGETTYRLFIKEKVMVADTEKRKDYWSQYLDSRKIELALEK